MFGINWRRTTAFLVNFLVVVLAFGLVSCQPSETAVSSGPAPGVPKVNLERQEPRSLASNIVEVSPPEALQELGEALVNYQPQVKIVSPQPDTVLSDNTVSVQFQVADLPLFKDSKWDMGPHLHVILDNEPYRAVYDVTQPIVFSDLTPGTHTIRAFASRPWHESFKNEGAYAQTTFHVFTQTPVNNPDPAQPLLTYSRPKGDYGAEPIMLDFYLTNAPLHMIAQADPEDEIADWRVRVTINDASFVTDRWQPLYLKGFKPDKNWVRLEFLDEQGNSVKNVYNDTIRLIEYKAGGKDTLSKLVRGDLKATDVRGIVDPNSAIKQPVTPESKVELTPEPIASPSPEPIPAPPKPSAPVETQPAPATTLEAPTKPDELEANPPEPSLEQPPTAKSKGFFSRFRQSSEPIPSPAPTKLPEIVVTPRVEPPTPEAAPEVVTPSAREPIPTPSPTPEVAPPVISPKPATSAKPKPGLFGRLRQPGVETVPPPVPEIIEAPEPTPVPETPALETKSIPSPEPETKAVPSLEPEIAPATPAPEPVQTTKPKPGIFGRLRQPGAETGSPVPETLPEILEAPEPASTPELTQPAFVQPSPAVESAPPAATAPDTETTETPTPEESEVSPQTLEKPAVGLKDVFLPGKAADQENVSIIQPTAEPEVPSRYLDKRQSSIPVD